MIIINKVYKNIPNIITIIGFIIVNFSLLMYNLTSNSIYLIFMILGFLCDYLDGYFARKLKLSSDLGNILDKIVDKINQALLLTTMIKKYKISKWHLIFYLLREIIMFIMRKLKYKPITSSFHGKFKTFIFPLSLIFFAKDLFFKKIFINLLSIYNVFTLLL